MRRQFCAAIPEKLFNAAIKAARPHCANRADMKLRYQLRPVWQLREQRKQRIAGGENIRLLDSLPVIEFEFGAGKRAAGARPHQIVGQRSPRRGGQTEDSILFHADAKRGIKPVPQIAVHFSGIAVIGALRRFGPAFVFKVESKKRRQASAKRIIRLERQQVTIVQDEKMLGIVAGKIQDGLPRGAESVGAVNRDDVPEKVLQKGSGIPVGEGFTNSEFCRVAP